MICREMIGRETDWKALEPEIRGASVEEIDTFLCLSPDYAGKRRF